MSHLRPAQDAPFSLRLAFWRLYAPATFS